MLWPWFQDFPFYMHYVRARFNFHFPPSQIKHARKWGRPGTEAIYTYIPLFMIECFV